MATEFRTDRGDYIEVIAGEPTWDNPAVWGSRGVEWKPGTGPHNEGLLRERAVAALAANQAFLATPNASITQADALAQIKVQARQINGLIRLLLQRVDEIED